jgi:RimJ/RimL family protein N-acetyltransferase
MAGVRLPIETERLVIRCFLPDADTESMLRVYGDDEVMRFVPGGALADESAVTSALEGYVQAHRRQGFSSWAVVERRTGRPIGDVGFGVFEPTADVELGYTLAREVWGRGYATEAARACLVAGLAQLGVSRIVAVVDAANEASLRIPPRIGMEQVETLQVYGRPHVLFAASRA